MLHLILHFGVPGIIALLFYRKRWWQSWLIMAATMLVDLDHLLVTPIFDPNRCSIGFHFLHSYIAIVVYVLFLFVPKLRIVGIGLLIHMALDFIECIKIDEYNF